MCVKIYMYVKTKWRNQQVLLSTASCKADLLDKKSHYYRKKKKKKESKISNNKKKKKKKKKRIKDQQQQKIYKFLKDCRLTNKQFSTNTSDFLGLYKLIP